ncbi:MAG: ParB/RepB/Spo0J family partition protein [Gemmatimonadota bacterium]|jgi:ParB family chromosome partitioning protein|nr:ParB/RepB/Spo0J family partition protein [Gemmatimonadota bacterium]
MSVKEPALEGKKKTRLGKGLGALLGEYLPDESVPTSAYRSVAVSTITPNPLQPRREFSAEQLAELEASIRESGLLQPLVVRPASASAPAGAEWELVAGERRLRAVRRLGWTEVPVIVREMDDRTLLVLAIVENVQRADLSPLDEAEGYRQLIDDFGYTQKDVAESVGRERSTVANLLRLLHLPASVQRLVSEGSVSMGHARAILGAGDERRMSDLARRVADEGLSVRVVEEMVRRNRQDTSSRKETRKAAGSRSTAPHLRQLEAELQRRLGTRVKIQTTSPGVGRVEIPFYNLDDFDRVAELLLGPEARG